MLPPSDRLRDRISHGLYLLSVKVAAPDRTADLPRCPDCQIGPDVGDDCPWCAETSDNRRREDDIAHGGYEQGFDEGYEAGLRKVAW